MKKNLRYFIAALALPLAFSPLGMMAQHEATPGGQEIPATVEAAPGVQPATAGTASPEALFDIEFNHDLLAAGSANGCAGVTFIHNEFWVSRWQSDTLLRLDLSGNLISKFQIPGLTGVRALTSDGTYLYAATNSTVIYQINPVNQTLTGTNTTVTAAVGAVRHCSYDPTLNSNAGGFWVGNFGTDIFAVSRSGAILSTIPAATHGLTGMYGSAFDPYSNGGPYLWVFAQMAPSNTKLYRITLPSGTPTPIDHDVMTDVGVVTSLTSGLAGGLFISDSIVPGEKTIIGVIQGTPRNILFGYELNEPVFPIYDARLQSLRSVEGYTQIPSNILFPESFDVNLTNKGLSTLDSIYVDFTVMYGGNSVYTDTRVVTNVGFNAPANVLSQPYTPSNGTGTYTVWAVARTGIAQPDSFPGNDSLSWSFEVTDSVWARDNGVERATPYAVGGNGDYCYITANYNLSTAATVTAVWIRLTTATAGDTTRAVVANTINNVEPTTIISLGTPTIISGSQNDYLLNIPGGLALTPGVYAFGCYQGYGDDLGLAHSDNVWTADVNYFRVGAGVWTASSVQTARFIRPVFGTPVGVSNDRGDLRGVQLFPNPTEGDFVLSFPADITEACKVTVTNAIGQVMHSQQLEATGAALIPFKAPAPGVYFVTMDNGVQTETRKLVVAH